MNDMSFLNVAWRVIDEAPGYFFGGAPGETADRVLGLAWAILGSNIPEGDLIREYRSRLDVVEGE